MNLPRTFAPLAPEFHRKSPMQTPVGEPDGVWVFGYGSLMWDGGFTVAERRNAVERLTPHRP